MKLKDLKPDSRNANKHSPAGMEALGKGLQRNGLGRSILISADDEIIAGNGVTEAAAELGIEKVRIIETDGTEVIAVKRTDVQSGTAKFYDMALSDNGIAKANIVLDAQVADAIAEDYQLDLLQLGEIPHFFKDNDGLGSDFILPNGERAPFQQMSFTFGDQQADIIKQAIKEMKETDEFKYGETFGNENSNGNALYLIVAAWVAQKI